ncbi:aminopeptidase P family protein [Coralliovum pocilloporae]|uniref:aminopeptidase P family protein n=1 Tax=Coralliovum pocilloporae TaxID=3066369 RepID=UPI003D9C25C9
MFQSYEQTSNPRFGRERCTRLRDWLSSNGLDGFLVPRSDEHQGEYVPPHAERLAWLTGFNGSAGLSIVLRDTAAIFVDGRYTIQVKEQVDTSVFEPRHLIENPPKDWLAETLSEGQKLAYDPWLHTVSEIKSLRKAVEGAGAELVKIDQNAVDAIWTDQPDAPAGAVQLHPLALAGESSDRKLSKLAETLVEKTVDATVLTQPDSIAWLLNVRGSDVSHTPLPLSFAILHKDGALHWFISGEKVKGIADSFSDQITQCEPDTFNTALEELGKANATVLLDPAWAADAIASLVEDNGGSILAEADICLLPKARKNAAEIEGTRQAHIRDGVAYAKFLCWLDEEIANGEPTEISVARTLEGFRAASGELKDISFDTISAAGPHGAINHYRVTFDTDLPLSTGPVFLIDSGAQYEDGTTDITRTIAVDAQSLEVRTRNTLVLKGMIAISTARFPKGTTGGHLDALARMALWQNGLDFDHGTGHGVGSYLSVHEGPQRISKASMVPLEPGMILSNEPGYYKEDAYGIRIENLIVVREAEEVPGGDRPMYSFETLTLAPIDQRLIEKSLLSDEEKAWLNSYHQTVFQTLSPHLGDHERRWLQQATDMIA